MCYYVFWKVFIGSAASAKVIKARLDNGDFSDFIGIMYVAFDKAIKSFKPKIYKDGTMKIGNWQYWFGQYLRMDAISKNFSVSNFRFNRVTKRHPMPYDLANFSFGYAHSLAHKHSHSVRQTIAMCGSRALGA